MKREDFKAGMVYARGEQVWLVVNAEADERVDLIVEELSLSGRGEGTLNRYTITKHVFARHDRRALKYEIVTEGA